jgi:hypothetical protein
MSNFSRKTWTSFVALYLTTLLVVPVSALSQGTSSKIANGRFTVWKKSLTDFSEKDDTPVCSFDDSKAAQDEANKLNQAEPGFQYVYTVVENPSAEAMALKAKDLLKNPKPGDTLKEFVNRIEDAYRNAKLAKTNLLSISGTISREKLTEANRLIDGFNRTRDEAKNYEGGRAVIRSDYPALSSTTAPGRFHLDPSAMAKLFLSPDFMETRP